MERKKFERKMNVTLFGEGKYHLIPSFFRMIMYLKKKKEEFSIVFRSFGEEIENVVYEFNKFCEGEHPCYNGRNNTPQVRIDGSKNQKDLRMKDPSQQIQFYRLSDEVKDTVMVTGGVKRVDTYTEMQQIEEDDQIEVVRDHLDIFTHIMETLKKYGSMAVSEDYFGWKDSGFKNNRSKLLLVD